MIRKKTSESSISESIKRRGWEYSRTGNSIFSCNAIIGMFIISCVYLICAVWVWYISWHWLQGLSTPEQSTWVSWSAFVIYTSANLVEFAGCEKLTISAYRNRLNGLARWTLSHTFFGLPGEKIPEFLWCSRRFWRYLYCVRHLYLPLLKENSRYKKARY
jgi:hypothetical protein